MATFLLTVEAVDFDSHGVRLSPGIHLSQTSDRPAIGTMAQGAKLELRRPNGSIAVTTLLTYGVSAWRGDDGAFYMKDVPADADIKLTLPGELSAADVPIGTEIWLIG